MNMPAESGKGLPLYVKILAGLLIGGALGLTVNYLGLSKPSDPEHLTTAQAVVAAAIQYVADPIGKIFLRLILMVVIPLVFSALVLGVVGVGDIRSLGRVGLKTLLVTLILSVTAVAVGIGLVNVIKPGASLSAEKREELKTRYSKDAQKSLDNAEKAKAKTAVDRVVDLLPENPLAEMVGALNGKSDGNGMLAVMFFALIVGIAMSILGPQCKPLTDVLQVVFDVCMVIIGFAMAIAPVAVACLVFSMTANLGFAIIGTLARFVLTVMLGLTIHLVVVYSMVLLTIGRKSPIAFFREVVQAMLTAFGTSSSNATLPTAMRVADEELKLPQSISRFVLTIGATGNQNGTALYEGVVVLFLAQLFGVELSTSQQITVVLMSVLAGIGTAGVPGGSIPVIVLLLQSVGVPGESIGIILGIDRILDMSRTVLNVTGDLVVAQCVATMEPGAARDKAADAL
jgi:DAACS family dicarboxylate/amino acid:cation (Na+ or H+) symporter